MELQIMERRAYQAWRASRKTQPFNLHEGGWTAIGFADPEIWHNGMLSATVDRQNHHWKNTGYEDLIARAVGERSAQVRASLYQQAERLVAQEVPVIPWGYRTKPYLLKPYVSGLQETVDGYVDLFQNVRIAR